MIARKHVPLRKAYETYKLSKADKPRTIEAYLGALDHWERLTDDPGYWDVDEQLLFEFQQGLLDDPETDLYRRRRSKRSRARAAMLQPTTVNKQLRHILAILMRLGPKQHGNPAGRGLIPVVPYVAPLPEDPREPRTASDEEISAIYQACESAEWPHQFATGVSPMHWWRALVVVLWNLGLRRGDFLSLKFSEIDVGKQTLSRKSEKTRKRKPKPLHPAVIAHISRIWPVAPQREYVFGLPDSQRQLYKQWYGIQAAAGMSEPYYTFHEIRKTCGTALYELAPAAAQTMLEHSSLATTDKYYANCDPILKRAVEKLEQPEAFLAPDEDPDDSPATIPFPRSG